MSETDFSTLKALVVDDQMTIRRVVRSLLTQLNFRDDLISEAEDGQSALEAVVADQPDVIICDINMEPMDGLAFLTKMKEDERVSNPSVPFLFLTSHTESDIVLKAMGLGVSGFLLKPVQLSSLKERLDAVL